MKEEYLETSSQKKHVPLKYLDNERKKYVHCTECSLILSSGGAHGLKAGTLINPSHINSTALFSPSLCLDLHISFLKKKIINKLVLLQKRISNLAGQNGPGIGRINLGAPFLSLSTHFEIRCILSSSLEMLIFFLHHISKLHSVWLRSHTLHNSTSEGPGGA